SLDGVVRFTEVGTTIEQFSNDQNHATKGAKITTVTAEVGEETAITANAGTAKNTTRDGWKEVVRSSSRQGDSLPLSSSPKDLNNNAISTSPKKKLSPLVPAFVPSSKAMISDHDRELLDALDSPTPHKIAYSDGSKMNAQVLELSG
ncbi:hypothetical protein A4A49_58903, partial [Nicotiana attenuata]